MAITSSLSSIIKPLTFSSLSPPFLLPYETTTTFSSSTYSALHKPKPLFKSLTLKPHKGHNYFTLSSLQLLCHSSSALNDTYNSITDEYGVNTDDEMGEISRGNQSNEDEPQQGESDDDDDDVEGGKDEGVETVESCRLFVGNLSYSMTSSKLSDVFSEAGKVQSVEIIYNKLTERSRGFGFVTMGSSEEAQEAIRMFDGSQIEGRTVKVNIPEVPRGGERRVLGPKIMNSYMSFVDTPHKIYVGNLDWSVTAHVLRTLLANQEGFVSAKVIYDKHSGRSRGFGFITFATAEAAESALAAFNGVELEGRTVRMNMASDRARHGN